MPVNVYDHIDTNGLSHKKGINIPCGYGDMKRMEREVRWIGASWLWNWNPDPPIFPGIESVPNIWGAANISATLAGNSIWLLGFNEPDEYGQANLSPAQAASLWPSMENRNFKLTSPQVMDLDWLVDFRNAYATKFKRAPRMDAVAIHCYKYAASDCIEVARRAIALAKQWRASEVWVTEFAFSPNVGRTIQDALDEAQIFVDYLETEPMITRYAWWSLRTECMTAQGGLAYDPESATALFHWNSSPSSFGKWYRRQ